MDSRSGRLSESREVCKNVVHAITRVRGKEQSKPEANKKGFTMPQNERAFKVANL